MPFDGDTPVNLRHTGRGTRQAPTHRLSVPLCEHARGRSAALARSWGGQVSSGLLYLAIVGVWALVLVPMWLRRPDAGDRSDTRLLPRRGSFDGRAGHPAGRPATGYRRPPASPPAPSRMPEGPAAGRAAGSPTKPGVEPATEPARRQPSGRRPSGRQPAGPPSRRAEVQLPGGRQRARAIARRRRRLVGVCLFFIVAVILAATGVTPWWVIAPPAVLLAGYLAMLRAARQIDAERRRMYAEQPENPLSAPAEPAEPAAEVIPLSVAARERDELYDQYTDAGRRAVGD